MAQWGRNDLLSTQRKGYSVAFLSKWGIQKDFILSENVNLEMVNHGTRSTSPGTANPYCLKVVPLILENTLRSSKQC